MKCGKLASYMDRWDHDEEVGLLVCDAGGRLAYKVTGYELCEDVPLLILEVGKPSGMEEFIKEAVKT